MGVKCTNRCSCKEYPTSVCVQSDITGKGNNLAVSQITDYRMISCIFWKLMKKNLNSSPHMQHIICSLVCSGFSSNPICMLLGCCGQISDWLTNYRMLENLSFPEKRTSDQITQIKPSVVHPDPCFSVLPYWTSLTKETAKHSCILIIIFIDVLFIAVIPGKLCVHFTWVALGHFLTLTEKSMHPGLQILNCPLGADGNTPHRWLPAAFNSVLTYILWAISKD